MFLMREVPLYTPSSPKTRTPPRASGIESSFSSLLLSNLELSDTNVYAPQIRALLGTAAHFAVCTLGPATATDGNTGVARS